MNRLMTFGIDKRWRSITVKTLKKAGVQNVLDIATGTGDLAIKLAKEIDGSHITGIDLSEGMISVGKTKVEQAGLSNRITLATADALQMPFADNSFDAITVAYGVRNFEHLDKGYAEMLRVLRPGGMLCVLELTPPSSPIVKPFYAAYTRGIIPVVGRLLSNDKRAYTYLPESIAAVPARQDMLNLMSKAGFSDTTYRSFTFGVCTLYTALK
jgi:demethylmenaquinone methyltransferase/2-methoxy-6-polyprenyl-1,4-benzoquinol methylase